MSTISVKDLIKGATAAQVKATIENILKTLEFPVLSWAPGRVARTIVDLFSRTVAPWTDLMALFAASGFLDFATNDWLTVGAEQVYNVQREPATFATGFVVLTNSEGGEYPFAIGELIVVNPTTNKQYRNTVAFTLLATSTSDPIAIEAVEIGSASSCAADTITELETTITGVTVNNDDAVEGDDAESDESLRLRCRLKLGALSPNGPADAYEYVARTQTLNGGVDVTRTRVVKDSNTGDVTCYVAGPSGAIGDVSTIQTAFDLYSTPLCIDAEVQSAVNQSQTFAMTIYLRSAENVPSADAQTLVQNGLPAWVKTLPIGGVDIGSGRKLFHDAIAAEASRLIFAEYGVKPISINVTTPGADVSYTDATRVVTAGSTTVTITQVAT